MIDAQRTEFLRDLVHKNSITTQEALELCDVLPAVDRDAMIGRWRGAEISTQHPLNGLLEVSGWYGKEFLDQEHVHPLLFRGRRGQIFAIDPKLVPLSLALAWPIPRSPLLHGVVLAARWCVQTHKTRARLRMLEYRGKVSATMIYDNLPICDTFRLLDEDTLLGVMDYKGMKQPFFFTLHRDNVQN